jgi:hypothetical protein
MGGYMRILLTAGVLALGLALTACEDFDPTAIFDVFDTKKKLAGERQPVFPDGTPGVPQGVPAELTKGYQAPPEQPKEAVATAAEHAQEKPKPKPKPKVVAKPQEPPSTGSVKPPQAGAQASASPNQPQTQAAPAASPWPNSTQPSGGVAWPEPPAAR